MRTQALRRALTMATSIIAVFVLAAPAAATHHLQHFKMHHGRIVVGGVAFDTPGAGIPNCPVGDKRLTVTYDDVAHTATVVVIFDLPFQNFLVGNNHLRASGIAHVAYTGGGSINITIPLTFDIAAYSPAPTCTRGALKCGGTAHLNITITGHSTPLPQGGTMYATATGSVLTTAPPCPGFLGQVVKPGAPLTLVANPNIQPPQPGAHFTNA